MHEKPELTEKDQLPSLRTEVTFGLSVRALLADSSKTAANFDMLFLVIVSHKLSKEEFEV